MNALNIPKITISLSFDKTVKKSELITLTTSKETADLLREIYSKDTFDWLEEMIMLCLNNAGKVIGFFKISSGGTNCAVCDPKVVFTAALNCGASRLILSHNHPSGNLKPSEADQRVTDKIKKGAEYLDMTLIDHIIITDEGYYSFNDEGRL